jgi:preprotein translocase subunit SecG
MFWVLIMIEVVISVLLILVILMQSSKGGGLAGTFGGAQVGMMFGVRRTADLLTNATQVLAIAFGVIALLVNIFFLPRTSVVPESVLQRGPEGRPAPTMQLPENPPPTETQQQPSQQQAPATQQP